MSNRGKEHAIAHQGLSRAERLRRRAEFQRVYNEGRRIGGRYFIGYVLFGPEGPLRVGVVASRKVGGAVHRNRAKRLLREAFRKNRPVRAVSADVVLIARAAIIGASFEEISRTYVRGVGRVLQEGRTPGPPRERSGARRPGDAQDRGSPGGG